MCGRLFTTESRRSGQIEQEVQTVQEKLFAWLDRRSVCGQECTSRESTLVQDRRLGWHTRGRDVFFFFLQKVTLEDDQKVDILREVQYKQSGRGVFYFEPKLPQYIPVRKDFIVIIEVQVGDITGELTEFRIEKNRET